MSYVVNLDTYHGPLDLLLYLIEKNEIDIFDIPIADIANQYIDYLYSTMDFNLEKLGDFLVMASYLLDLKVRMLFPQTVFPKEGEEESCGEAEKDPREELVQRLLDYKKYKKAAEYLEARQKGDLRRVFYRSQDNGFQPEEQIVGNIGTLMRVYQSLIQEKLKTEKLYSLPSGDINIGDKMDEILEELQGKQEGLVFQKLFAKTANVREILGLFLALLELVRLQKVDVIQERPFCDIKVSLRVGEVKC